MIFHCNRQAEGRQSHCMVDKTEALGRNSPQAIQGQVPQTAIYHLILWFRSRSPPSGTVSTSADGHTPASQPGLLPALAILIFVVTSTNQDLTCSFDKGGMFYWE